MTLLSLLRLLRLLRLLILLILLIVYFMPTSSALFLYSLIHSHEEPEKKPLITTRPSVRSDPNASSDSFQLMSRRTWVCDICHASNNPNSSVCSHCHQARSITPIQASPVYDNSQASGTATVDMPPMKTERRHRSHHGGRRQPRRHSRREEPVMAEPVRIAIEGCCDM